ncbi:MAG TPA: plastocyanin/azurin family copper-binding protein [Gemmatimonadaceae bacterium]|nr:plastocyanin/azurin family copper-binding protein [Gemmatimonadaceae bacterium]
MRLNGLALVASALVLAACGGGDKGNTDTGAAAATPAATTPTTTDTGAAKGAAPAGGTAAAAPVTGAMKTVNMVGDDKGYRFEPAKITVKAGDGIDFKFVSGGPHNVAADESVPADVKAQLDANMQGEKVAPAASRMLMAAGDDVKLSFANVKPGTYKIICQPHAAMNMTMDVTVQ